MSQSLDKVLVHCVFSTKYRQHLIDSSIESNLHGYIAAICRSLECRPIEIGGYIDHIHVFCRLSKKITIMDLMRDIKKKSSQWIKTKGDKYSDFYWQDGYAIFSISQRQQSNVINYIKNQQTHHNKISFQDESRTLFKKHEIEYDERYVWD